MGDGFSGDIKMAAKLMGTEISVEAKGAFGSKDGDRYWYVNALASGFKIPVGTITITGLGGGASYAMRKDTKGSIDATVMPMRSNYIPDFNMGVGFNAMLTFSIGTGALAKAEGSFEMMFNRTGGLNYIGVFGNCTFMPGPKLLAKFNDAARLAGDMQKKMTDITNKAGIDADSFGKLGDKFLDKAKSYYPEEDNSEKDNGVVSAFVGITYDFENHVLHANLELYVNVAGGIIRGRGANNRAGWAVMHFAPDEWYVHLGTPTDRLGLKMGVGSIALETGGYFMLGSHIPASPPPPPIVAEILGIEAEKLDYMRDLNALGEGKGFAFGADFSFTTGDLAFLMFYASFNAGFGFDIMLKDYGKEVSCEGRSGPIGVNGWYANGQSYVYLQGELGIRVKIGFVKKKVPIIKAGAAVLMQAMLPNPVWFHGYMGGYFSILGGMIKGRFRFELSLGEKCVVVAGGSPLDNIQIISDVTPADKSTEVDVFAVPQAVFNFAMEKPFDLDDDRGTKTYRVKLNSFQLTTATGQAIPGAMKWNDKTDAVMYESDETLPPNTELKTLVEVSFEELKNGSWQVVYEDGQKAVEKKEVNFTTGGAPLTVPLSNIEYSYPVIEQHFYYPKEYGKGYIQLQRGQSYLFAAGKESFEARFEYAAGKTLTSTFAYDSVNKKLLFDLPAVATGQKFNIYLSGKLDPSLTAGQTTKETTKIQDADNDIEVASNKAASAVSVQDKPHDYLSYSFASSRYGSFSEKMKSHRIQQQEYQIITSDVGYLHIFTGGAEAFDIAEIAGVEKTAYRPLIQGMAVLTDAWYNNDIQPLVYAGYPVAGIRLDRDTAVLGLPPVRGLDVPTWYISDAEINTGAPNLLKHLPFDYNLGYYYKRDFSQLQYKIVNTYKNGSSNPQIKRFIEGTFPFMRPGKYPVQIKYVLPGGVVSSVYNMEFEYKR
jgi:hypothetical protein